MKKIFKPRIILASQSPRRKEILKQLKLNFEVIPSDFVEQPPEKDANPEEYVQLLSLGKASKVAESLSDQNEAAIIIGCDTVAVLKGEIIGKPKSAADAKNILQSLSGTEHQVISGLCILLMPEYRAITTAETTELRMKKMSKQEIEDYVNSGEALGKAGAYAIQETGDRFISVVKGSIENVAGFPLDSFLRFMKRIGIDIKR